MSLGTNWLTALKTILLNVTLYGTSTNTALILYEPFAIGSTPSLGQYTVGAVVPQNPTVEGFSGAWRSQAGGSFDVNGTGLTYADPLYIGSSGGKVLGSDSLFFARNMRTLSTAYTSATADTVYMSLLMKLNDTNAGALRAFELHNGGDSDGNRTLQLGFGNADFGSSTNFRARINNNSSLLQDIGPVNTNVNLFVLKFSFSAVNNADQITIWMNPSLAGGDPAGGVLFSNFNFAFDRFALGEFLNTPQFAEWDEFRMGNTFNDVAIVPEPESWSLGLLGLAGLGLIWPISCRRRGSIGGSAT